ncbi:TPA: hypothetical protein ACH3X1_001756 [Trebouxia sp. C0004]
MLFELDAQVKNEITHTKGKVKDRSKACKHVLDAWRVEMDKYSFMRYGTPYRIRLLPIEVGCVLQPGKNEGVCATEGGEGAEGSLQAGRFVWMRQGLSQGV